MDDKDPGKTQNKPACKYGAQCYQRNRDHIEKYEHPQSKSEKSAFESEILPAAKKPRVGCSSLKQQKLSSFFRTKACTNPKNKVESNPDQTVEKKNSNHERRDTDDESSSHDESIEESNSGEVLSPTVTVNNENWPRIIEKLFFVTMPEDFFSLWEFCCSLSPKNPRDALKSIDLELVGPYDVLNGDMTEDIESSVACRHWRYFYDPPEFQTVLKSNRSDLLHFGYYRDDPKKLPVFVGLNRAAKDAIITAVGENIFAAINWCINHSPDACSPFQKMQLSSLKNELNKWAKDHAYSLITCTENMRKRDKSVVAKTFHHAGIVVPYDKKTELGYRPLAKTNVELMKILNQIENSKSDGQRMTHLSELHEVITWANIAVDEGDIGTALELGINLFCFDSKHFNTMILQLLTSAYKLLQRNSFAEIIKAHLTDRKKGDNLSILK